VARDERDPARLLLGGGYGRASRRNTSGRSASSSSSILAAFLAGKAYTQYRRRGGTRTSPRPDFLIGAHAAIAGYRLLTRDATRYRTCFPKVDLIAP
jgi:hypothetical protein